MPNSWSGRAACIGLLVTLGLTACGGGSGGEALPQVARWMAREAVAQARLSPQSLPGTSPLGTAAPASARISVDELLAWAEQRYPELFPAGPSSEGLVHDGISYTLRWYPTTGNYLGVSAEGAVYVYGEATGQVLRNYGQMNDYACQVAPERCVAAACTTRVESGFGGDLNAEYPQAGGAEGGDGNGGADGSDGSGSAGVGGGEGKVLGGRLRVLRLADGQLLGEAVTDNQLGLATIRWCRSDLPVLLELGGAPGARYFDEAVNDLVPFPTTQKLRALVDRFDENIGVSALTEAAYRYAMNNIVNDPAAIRAGQRALVGDGVPIGLTGAQVRQANGVVLAEVNRQFTSGLRQTSMRALATPIDQFSSPSALPLNRYGRMAALGGGLAKLARGLSPNAPAPALSATAQLAVDMTDGRIDGFALNGSDSAALGQRGYDNLSVSENWTLGQGVISERFGQGTTSQLGEPILNRVDIDYLIDPVCGDRAVASYVLRKDGFMGGSVRTVKACGAQFESLNFWNLYVNARPISDPTTLPTVFAIAQDGKLSGWGESKCGSLEGRLDGNDFTTSPRDVKGLPPVVSVVGIDAAFFALSTDGELWAWGVNRNRQLDPIGEAPDGMCSLRNLRTGQSETHPVFVRPRRLGQPGGIKMLSGGALQGYAIGRDGSMTVLGPSAIESVVLQTTGGTYGSYPRTAGIAADTVKLEPTPGGVFLLRRDGGLVLASAQVSDLRLSPVPGHADAVDITTLDTTLASLDSQGAITLSTARCTSFSQCGDVTTQPGAACRIVDEGGSALPWPGAVRLGRYLGRIGFIGSDGLLHSLEVPPGNAPCQWRRTPLDAG